MGAGVLIAESLRAGGTSLKGFTLTVGQIERVSPKDISPWQRSVAIPGTWTLLHFEAEDEDLERLAEALAGSLENVGWYADFHTETETFVVIAGRVFRYASGDGVGRAEAEGYARGHGVPETQIDWP